MNRSLASLALFFVCAFVIFFAQLCKNWGIHVDENIYLGADIDTYKDAGIFGDALYTGKPFFFYSVNYIWTEVASHFGRFKYISIYWFYGFLHCIALVYAAGSINTNLKDSIKFLSFLLFCPLIFLSAVQPMNESLLMPFLIIAFASLSKLSKTNVKSKSDISSLGLLYISCLVIGLVKITGIPALLLLIAVFLNDIGIRKALACLLFAGLGLGFSSYISAQVALHNVHYGGILEILFDSKLKFSHLPQYLYAWLFFVNPVLFIAVYLNKRPGLDVSRFVSKARLMATGSLVFSILLLFAQKAEHNFFTRHMYPCIGVTLLVGTVILIKSNYAFFAAVLLNFVILANLYGLTLLKKWPEPISLWPNIVSEELYNSGWTMLPGAALLKWAVFADGDEFKNLCFLIPDTSDEWAYLQAVYLKKIVPGASYFGEDTEEFHKCLKKAFIYRNYSDYLTSCSTACPQGADGVNACRMQKVGFWSEGPGGLLQNQICFPAM